MSSDIVYYFFMMKKRSEIVCYFFLIKKRSLTLHAERPRGSSYC
jgi:hypothetical protein